MSKKNWETIFHCNATQNDKIGQVVAQPGDVWGADPLCIQNKETGGQFAQHKAATSHERPVACVGRPLILQAEIVPGTSQTQQPRSQRPVLLKESEYPFLSKDTALLCRHYQTVQVTALIKRWGKVTADHWQQVQRLCRDESRARQKQLSRRS